MKASFVQASTGIGSQMSNKQRCVQQSCGVLVLCHTRTCRSVRGGVTYSVMARVVHSRSSVGGTVASWLVHLTPDRVVRVQTLAGDVVLCSHSASLHPGV